MDTPIGAHWGYLAGCFGAGFLGMLVYFGMKAWEDGVKTVSAYFKYLGERSLQFAMAAVATPFAVLVTLNLLGDWAQFGGSAVAAFGEGYAVLNFLLKIKRPEGGP